MKFTKGQFPLAFVARFARDLGILEEPPRWRPDRAERATITDGLLMPHFADVFLHSEVRNDDARTHDGLVLDHRPAVDGHPRRSCCSTGTQEPLLSGERAREATSAIRELYERTFHPVDLGRLTPLGAQKAQPYDVLAFDGQGKTVFSSYAR